jgi:RND family efflux transporter MFP subunit
MRVRAAITTALAVTLVAGCSKERVAGERPTPVEVQSVQPFAGSDIKRFSAVIQPYEQVDLSFRVGGYVDSIAQTTGVERKMRSIQDGDRVNRGTVLARLHSVDYDARVQQAKASVAEAEAAMSKAQLDQKRAANLMAVQSLTKPEMDAANSNLEASQARLDSARGRLQESLTSAGDTVLRAPFSATVLKRNISQGTLASPGAPAFVLADTSVVKAIFGVPDKLIPRMKIGDPLELRADAFTTAPLRGKVSRISASADPKSRVFEVEVSLSNSKQQLKVGMIATLVIEDTSPELGARVIPISALVSSAKLANAYAIFVTSQENGRAVARLTDVEVGETLGNMIVLKKGPSAGTQVITTGAGLLRDGEPIEVAQTPTAVAAEK